MIHTVGTADEVGVFVFEFTPTDFAATGTEIVQELRLQRLAECTTGSAELIAHDFLVVLG
ncbi:hypothetical protein D3C84_960070 [compost metagenome]